MTEKEKMGSNFGQLCRVEKTWGGGERYQEGGFGRRVEKRGKFVEKDMIIRDVYELNKWGFVNFYLLI